MSVVFNKSTVAALNHFILMFQENRSFDQILGHLPQYWQKHGYPAVQLDGTPANASNPGLDGTSVVSAFHMISVCVENTNPAWSSAHIDHNLNDPISMVGTMDGFVTSAARHAQGANLQDVAGIRAMGYYNGDDLPYYYFMASNFATSDRWFSSVLSRSEPNHAYAMSGTSAGHAYPRPPGSPTLTNKTIFQLLDENNISWKIYYTDLDPNGTPDTALQDFSYYSVHPENIVPVQPNYFDDVAHGTLPQVAWIETGHNSGLDEHPGEDDSNPGGSVQVGSHYVSTLINALMKSTSWKDSAFFLSYDEAGGFYDHVPPQPAVYPDDGPPALPTDFLSNTSICSGAAGSPACTFQITGFRVPLIVVSPFTRAHYVSHTVADHTAILKLIETRFGLPSLTHRDSAQSDISEFFDFARMPWKKPPTPPEQPTNAPCYEGPLP